LFGIFFDHLYLQSSNLVIWLLAIVSIRIVSIIIVYFKYKMFAILHTFSNKITGLLLFVIPIVIGSSLEKSIIYFVVVIASVSAIEELGINILSNKIEVNIKNIFSLMIRSQKLILPV
jgi:CDP-diacylglycerol--glycerol-3-phosphate 3-phosphatidyltransferase